MGIKLDKVILRNDKKIHFDEKTWIEMEYNDIQFIISKAVREYRKEHNLTQQELANKLKVKQPMIVKVESGECNPSVKFLVKLWNTLSSEEENFGKMLLEKIAERVDYNFYTSLKIKGKCEIKQDENVESLEKDNVEFDLLKKDIKITEEKYNSSYEELMAS